MTFVFGWVLATRLLPSCSPPHLAAPPTQPHHIPPSSPHTHNLPRQRPYTPPYTPYTPYTPHTPYTPAAPCRRWAGSPCRRRPCAGSRSRRRPRGTRGARRRRPSRTRRLFQLVMMMIDWCSGWRRSGWWLIDWWWWLVQRRCRGGAVEGWMAVRWLKGCFPQRLDAQRRRALPSAPLLP